MKYQQERGRYTWLIRAAVAAMALAASLAVLAGCGGGSSSSSSSSTASEGGGEAEGGGSTTASDTETSGKKIVIGYSDPVASNPAQQAVARGEEELVKDLGWELIHLDANLSASKQVSDIESLVSRKVDAINSFTLEQGAAEEAYKRASEAGIPVAGQSSTSPYIFSTVWNEQNYDCNVAEMAAEYIAKRVPGAKTLVIGGPPVGAITQYTKCFVEAAKKSGLDVIGEKKNTSDTAAGSQPVAAAMINENPDVQAMWGYNDPSALGAGNALKAAGKSVWEDGSDEDGVIVIGSNGSTEGIEGIKSGLQTVSYDINPDKVGADIIALFAEHFVGGKPIEQLPKDIVVPTTEWDISNLDEYVPPMEREIDLAAAEKEVNEAK
jgi:ribose transport system substrate-binding protein